MLKWINPLPNEKEGSVADRVRITPAAFDFIYPNGAIGIHSNCGGYLIIERAFPDHKLFCSKCKFEVIVAARTIRTYGTLRRFLDQHFKT
jgi:hypothetical protein